MNAPRRREGVRRLRGQGLSERQARMQELITKAKADLKAHFVRFNEMVEEEIERRLGRQ